MIGHSRKLMLVLFCISVCTVCSQQKTFSEKALADTFIDLEGNEVSFGTILKNNEGKVVLLDIWASWCKDCIVGMPIIEELERTYSEVSFVYISLDRDEKSWKKGMEKYDFTSGHHYWVPKGWKSDLFSSIDLDWIPRYMVLDKKGEIKLFKAIKANDERIVKQINKLKT